MGFFGDVFNVVTAPITAVPKAVGSIASGGNVVASIANTTPVGQNLQAAGNVANAANLSAGSIPILGGDVKNIQNYASNPYDFSNALSGFGTAGKIGGVGYLGASGGVKDALTGAAIGSSLQKGNIGGALNSFGSNFGGDYGSLISGASSFFNKVPSPSSSYAPQVPDRNPAGLEVGTAQTSGAGLFILIGVTVAGYLIYKRMKK